MPYLYPVEVRDSAIDGKGLFALEDIPKGEVYWVWSAEYYAQTRGFNVQENIPYSKEQLQALKDNKQALYHILHRGFYYASADLFLFFRDGSEFMNHSYDPNSQIIYPASNDFRDLKSYTLREIKKGEQINQSYNNYLSLRAPWISDIMRQYNESKFKFHCQIAKKSTEADQKLI